MKLPALTPTLHFHFVVQPFLAQCVFTNEGISLASSYATTQCSFDTGSVMTDYAPTASTKYGPPDCLIAHESEHVRYMTPCCQKAKLCFGNGHDEDCRKAYNQWSRKNTNYEECEAYKIEAACLQQQIDSGRFNQEGVTMLTKRLSEATKTGQAYCKKAVEVACPFDDAGNIV